MPFTITPSTRSQKAWGNLSHHPIRLDITALILAQLVFVFALTPEVWNLGRYYPLSWTPEDPPRYPDSYTIA